MIYKINEKSRIKVKFSLKRLGIIICLQRKKWYGYKDVSWIYPSIFQDKQFTELLNWLLWAEKKESISEYEIAKSILNKGNKNKIY